MGLCLYNKGAFDVTEPQLLGTSGVRTMFNIQVQRGVDIARYSSFQGEEAEAEVLIFPGTSCESLIPWTRAMICSLSILKRSRRLPNS